MSSCEKLNYEKKHFLSKQPICKGMLQQRFNLNIVAYIFLNVFFFFEV